VEKIVQFSAEGESGEQKQSVKETD